MFFALIITLLFTLPAHAHDSDTAHSHKPGETQAEEIERLFGKETEEQKQKKQEYLERETQKKVDALKKSGEWYKRTGTSPEDDPEAPANINPRVPNKQPNQPENKSDKAPSLYLKDSKPIYIKPETNTGRKTWNYP